MNQLKPTRNISNLTLMLIAGGFMLLGVVLTIALYNNEGLGDALFGLLFVVVGLVFFIATFRSWYTHYRVGKPEITISKTAVSLGETITVTFLNTFNQSVEFDTLLIKLIFKESATYKQGTNTRTVHHEEVIDEFSKIGSNFTKGSFLSEEVEFTIPQDSMHSLSVNRNKLRWLVEFEMVIPKMANFKESYEITVLPEIVSPEWQ